MVYFIEGVVIPDFLSSMNAEPDPDGESFEELFERFASMRGTYIHYSPSTLHELLTPIISTCRITAI